MNNKYKALHNEYLYQTAAMKQYEQHLIDNNILTLQNIKDTFYAELASDSTIIMSLDQYLREYYTPIYDAELNFIGYQLK